MQRGLAIAIELYSFAGVPIVSVNKAAAMNAVIVRIWFPNVQSLRYLAQSVAPSGLSGFTIAKASFSGTLKAIVTAIVPMR